MRVLKENVVPSIPSANFSASTIDSHDSSASKTFKWDLSTSTYAPIIGNVNTESGVSSYNPAEDVLYFEGSSDNSWTGAWKNGSTGVWINAG